MKQNHEIKDPIHAFVKHDSVERQVINSRPFQRLRHIHQLSMAYLVYPGATHRRFEHSLGVMELASRVFDVVTDKNKLNDRLRNSLEQVNSVDQLAYWRRVLRMAALCHDLGHLPFSHGIEGLLPEGWDHERMTRILICSDEMKPLWQSMRPPLDPIDIVKLAVGPQKATDLTFSDWEAILAEIVTGDAFGVDRMDYLLRDSLHTGVPYGEFDHYRLIDTLRILTPPSESGVGDTSLEPSLGIEKGGLAAAEAMLLARYYMFRTVYFHPVVRIYGIHLMDFLFAWLDGSPLPIDPVNYLLLTDNEVMTDLLKAARDRDRKGHDPARRIVERAHYKVLYEWNQKDASQNPRIGRDVFDAAEKEFGKDAVRYDKLPPKSGKIDFLVLLRTGEPSFASTESSILDQIPPQKGEYVFIDPNRLKDAQKWLKTNFDRIVKNPGSVNNEES